jgi:hypothetical protein
MQGNVKFNDISGTKVIRRIACEAAANLYGRYEIAGNIYSKWYPKSPIVPQPTDPYVNYITEYNVNLDPNQFGYNKDLNALNELTADTGIFNTTETYNTIHPFRIHRGGKLGRQDKTRSWRTFLPLDYYEIKKQVGRIINIDGQDDRLIIHCEHALLLTQDKTKLETDVLKVTLGSADIFQFEPQDGQSSPLGYAGASHDLGCIRTPAGYFFVDPKSRELFMYKGQLDNIGGGLYNTFLDIVKVLFKQRNPYVGDGITVGYDPEYKRLLFTVKQTKTTKSVRFDLTDEDIPTLAVGDYVYMHGRVLEFLGVNNINTSGVTCEEDQAPVISSFDMTIAAGTYSNQVLTTLNGPFVDSVVLTSTVPITSLFTINPITRELIVNGMVPVDVFQLNCTAYAPGGATTNFYITINAT